MPESAPNAAQKGPGITRISVTGFKSLAEKMDVEIRPLTVLAGANSSGKSSLLQPLLLMKQTLESGVTPAGPFLLSGHYTRYTDATQFLTRSAPPSRPADELSIDVHLGEETSAGFTYAADSDRSFEVIETRGSEGGDQVKPGPWRINRRSQAEDLKDLVWFNVVASRMGLTDFAAERYRFYHCIRATGPSKENSALSKLWELHSISILNSELRRLIYVPGLRGDQQRKWLTTAVPPFGTFEGPFESYVPSLIQFWNQSSDDSRIGRLIGSLGRLELASGIETERLNESEIEVRVPRTSKPTAGDFVNLADVGLAVSAALPVLVGVIQANPGQLVYIEQPELHLHPRAQWRLAQLLARAASRGVRLVIETHSSLLLQGILTCIAKGDISRDNVALHWFARNENGVTHVTTANVDSEGRVGNWPADFDDVELKASNEYLDAVESKLMASKGIE